MWDAEKVEFTTISIRGKEYDAKMFGVVAVNPPKTILPGGKSTSPTGPRW